MQSKRFLNRRFPPVLAALGVAFALALVFSMACTAAEKQPTKGVAVNFNRDIRPILSENCFKCHGPDDGARKAKLRVDLREAGIKPAKSGKVAIMPGAPEKSEMIARVPTTDDDDRMPPLKTGKKLTSLQIESL